MQITSFDPGIDNEYYIQYIDDTFNIDNLEFQKRIPDIYPAELQLINASI